MGSPKLGKRESPCLLQVCSYMLLPSSLGYRRSVLRIYVHKGFIIATPWVVKSMLPSAIPRVGK
jgi:hypothetical protein